MALPKAVSDNVQDCVSGAFTGRVGNLLQLRQRMLYTVQQGNPLWAY